MHLRQLPGCACVPGAPRSREKPVRRSFQRYQMTQRMDYEAVTPAGVKALDNVYSYVFQSGLPKALLDLVYLRVSQINGCAYMDMHSRDLLKAGVTCNIWCRRAWVSCSPRAHASFAIPGRSEVIRSDGWFNCS
jgi:AhpD family alkylhydroperoxidase